MIECIDYEIATGYCSQFGEDKWIADNLKLPATGFYLDIGAARPNSISNTYILRKLGWTGLQIDADANYKPLWEQEGLELIVGIVWIKDTAPFSFHPNPELSKITDSGNELPAIKLNDLLAERKVTNIDLLSIDIEGVEYDVLTSLDWDKYKPSIIIWEYKTNGVEDTRLCTYLESKGYKQVHQTFANYIYTLNG